MAQQEIDIGTEGNDGTGDSIRESFKKVNENFQELYAVFGVDGQIGFTDLADTPISYFGNENKIPVVNGTSSGLEFREFASNSDLDGSPDTIGFDYSVSGKVIVKQEFIDINLDKSPEAGGPIDMGGFALANVGLDADAVNNYNAIHSVSGTISLDDLVINKRFADLTYQKKFTVGGGIRLEDEPVNTTEYFKTITSFTTGAGDAAGNIEITDHGYTDDFTGLEFNLRSENVLPTARDSDNLVVQYDSTTAFYMRVRDEDTVSAHLTEADAVAGTNKIELSGGTGPFSLVDADFNSNLEGNWLDSVPLPRKSVVRRQGDTMTGPLNLSDHPGALRGAGTPNAEDDLQAATKLYVDNLSFESKFNLYVSTGGSDDQTATPAGSEGRSESYAYKTIAAACRKAEEIILASPYVPGPYMQDITYGGGEAVAEVITAGVENPVTNRSNAKALIELNKDFIAAEVTAYVDAQFPDFDYDRAICQRDIKLILDSIALDIMTGDNANYLSRWAGFRYYSSKSGQIAVKTQLEETLAGIEHAKTIVTQFIITNTAVSSPLQSRFSQVADPALVVDSNAETAIANKFDTVTDIIQNGLFTADPVRDGATSYKLNLTNGNQGTVDQARVGNVDIIPGKVIRGKTSGAIGQIVNYLTADESSETFDYALLNLLEPIEFIPGEELEFGNIVRDTQISIRIESGVYEEDYPIRVPANVSIKGDEFRRCIIKPKDRRSQSPNANIFFYRDREFDGLVLGRSEIETIGSYQNVGANGTRSSAAGTYTITDTDYITTGYGSAAIFEVTVAGDGSVTVTVENSGQDFRVNDRITIDDAVLGNTGAPNISFLVTSVPNGVEYQNPLTGTIDGYFGRHYLSNPADEINVGQGLVNIGRWNTQAQALLDNKNFIAEQTDEYLDSSNTGIFGQYSRSVFRQNIRNLVDSVAEDLINGGLEFALENQGVWFDSLSLYSGIETEIQDAIDHASSIMQSILLGVSPTTYGSNLDYPLADLFYGDTTPAEWEQNKLYRLNDVVSFTIAGTERIFKTSVLHESGTVFDTAEINLYWEEVIRPEDTVDSLVTLIKFAFDSAYNPPLNNKDIDVFLMNDSTILRNITVQGHGGFMCVLDPEGQILTRSPYIQTGSSFTQGINKQSFRGGLFVDAFCGNSALQVVSKEAGSPFVLNVQSLAGQGLFIRRPETPSAFYIDGKRFQVNTVTNYDPDAGTAVLVLDPTSNEGQGFTGSSNLVLGGVDLDDLSSPIPITMQTAGNRSMLGNDFTQINDLGYGLVCVNGGISEMVSMFTYYCHTSYYAKNGSEIRSLTGSSCYGEFGLVAEGADPNEVPDVITLQEDLNVAAQTFSAEIILRLSGNASVTAGETITQAGTNATGVVKKSSASTYIYLDTISGTFNTTGTLTGSTAGAITPTVESVVADTYQNLEEQLFLYAYDFVEPPSNNSEFDLYHAGENRVGRYNVTSIEENANHVIGGYLEFGSTLPVISAPASGTSAIFNIYKSKEYGYTVELLQGGTGYSAGDTFTVSGEELGGSTPTNDATVTIDSVDDNNVITGLSITGAIATDGLTPQYSGKIYRLNFSTGEEDYSSEGLIAAVDWGDFIDYRRNTQFILDNINSFRTLNIRPSTALIFDENPEYVYRSISFQAADATGAELPDDQTAIGIDAAYDYIRLIVDDAKATEAIGNTLDTAGLPLTGGTTKGNTAGDTTIAIVAAADPNEIYRLNNNARTPVANRPESLTGSLVEAPVITWRGKKFYVFNYRTVTLDGTDEVERPFDDFTKAGNEYALVDIEETGESINSAYTGSGLPESVVVPGITNNLRAGIVAGSGGDITINISTCRVTGHDFLNVGTGGFNTSNYPNVIFGPPREPDQTKEVRERGKGRVFYVSTDQNGVFRVGRFFSVDQGTGTVSFSASIALSNVDGIGFKRGVTITEFSTDSTMQDNASDSVPTESAVRGYLDRRLGYDVNGSLVPNPLGPSVLAANGAVPMTDDLDAADNRINNLLFPASETDAANKAYVDGRVEATDSLTDLQDTNLNNIQEAQLLVASGYKRISIDADTIVNGQFLRGDTIIGSESGAEGTIEDVYSGTSSDGAIVNIIYTPVSGVFSSAGGVGQDTVEVTGGAQGVCIDGPDDEWMNAVYDNAADIEFSILRSSIESGGSVTDRFLTLDIQYKPGSIFNADVASNAAISQSKLNMNTAGVLEDASGISQGDLGLSAFKDVEFTATDGFIELQTASSDTTGIQPEKITWIDDQHVVARLDSSGTPAQKGPVDTVSFNDVVNVGGGLLHSDIPDNDAGSVIRTGAETYDITAITTTGASDSIVKTTSNGTVQVQQLVVGSDPAYKILDIDGTNIVFTTPGQGPVFTAEGQTDVEIRVGGKVDVIGDGVALDGTSDSSLKTNSTSFSTAKSLAARWIYSSFIEAPDEKNDYSSGISIGGGTGITQEGEVAVFVADIPSNTTRAPFIFSKNGVIPDETADTALTGYDIGGPSDRYNTVYARTFTGGSFNTENILPLSNNAYNIGSNGNQYNTVYANLFSGTALEAYYADLAENYAADAQYEPGTVVVIGGDAEITQSTTKDDHKVVGVVSTNPAYLMNKDQEADHVTAVALQGRLLCKVIGKVERGDMLVTSAVPGHAMVNNDAKPGRVIGKALESKHSSDRGVIEVLVGKH